MTSKSYPKLAASAVVLGAALLVSLPRPGMAQNPVITNAVPESEAVTVHAKITAINPQGRAVTLSGASGRQVTVTAGPIVRLEMLKVGDQVNAKYYRSVAFLLAPPQAGNSAPVSNDQMTQLTAQSAQAPGGAGVRLTQISGTVVGIELTSNSVEMVNPSGGGVYTMHVTDPARVAMLSTLQVGDTVTAVVSQALAVSIEPAPKSWF